MSRVAKRSMDFVVASAALLIFAPLLAIIALAIWLAMGRPVLFRQVRSGYKGKPFTLTKFKRLTALRLVGPRPLLVEYLDRYTPSRSGATTFFQVLRGGHRLTAATPSPGNRNSSWICGTSITGASGWT
ncbi:MAG: Lipid carrier : UDP-N-acetylgalactosaminyltransferase [Acidobacteriaceae bacterium]|nr:Lipid carrier : UDP-N-acetylgalactosaminyltransferase [Acidobacteriaceae bacterium]